MTPHDEATPPQSTGARPHEVANLILLGVSAHTESYATDPIFTGEIS